MFAEVVLENQAEACYIKFKDLRSSIRNVYLILNKECYISTESDEEKVPGVDEEEEEDDEEDGGTTDIESLPASEEMSGSDAKDVSVGQLIAKAKAQQVRGRNTSLVSRLYFMFTLPSLALLLHGHISRL